MCGSNIGLYRTIRRLEDELVRKESSVRKSIKESEINERVERIRTKMCEELQKAKVKADSFRGFMFEPKNEAAVVMLFGRYYDFLGFDNIIDNENNCDCRATKNNKCLRVEFEYRSGNFILHKHDVKNYDLVICWEKDKELGLPILELKKDLAVLWKRQ